MLKRGHQQAFIEKPLDLTLFRFSSVLFSPFSALVPHESHKPRNQQEVGLLAQREPQKNSRNHCLGLHFFFFTKRVLKKYVFFFLKNTQKVLLISQTSRHLFGALSAAQARPHGGAISTAPGDAWQRKVKTRTPSVQKIFRS